MPSEEAHKVRLILQRHQLQPAVGPQIQLVCADPLQPRGHLVGQRAETAGELAGEGVGFALDSPRCLEQAHLALVRLEQLHGLLVE